MSEQQAGQHAEMAEGEAQMEALVARVLPEYGYTPAGGAVARLAMLMARVAREPQRLVGSTEPEVLVRRHLGESLYLGTLVPLAEGGGLVDIGPGGGFPGLALAAAWPQLTTTLVEATGKKAHFLQATVAALGLEASVQVENTFLERHPRPGSAALAARLQQARWVTARALERMAWLPQWLGRWLAPETEAAFWVSEELAASWRTRYPEWAWQQFHPLPGARTRGIVLARASRL